MLYNPQNINVEWVTPDIIREQFNQCQYYEQSLSGELRTIIFGYNHHLNKRQRQKVNEPKCTRSQMILYLTLQGEPLALTHQYKRKDGTLGGSGKPDPKRIIVAGKIIAVKQSYE